MNRYHATHPDPEIRQKYQEWLTASLRSNAMGGGYNSTSERDAEKEREKARRKSVASLLDVIGGQQVKGSKFTESASKKQANKRMRRMQRTGGQRGS